MSTKLSLFAFLFFLAGFGLVIFSFIRLVLGLHALRSKTFAIKTGNVTLRIIIFISGVLLILFAQACFWFNSSLKAFQPLHKNVPMARITFAGSEYEKPRLILQTFDSKLNPLVANELFLNDTIFQIELEVVKFKNLGRLLGLNEVYRFSRLIYLSDYEEDSSDPFWHALGNEDNKIVPTLESIKKVVALAHTKKILTDPFRLDTLQALDIFYNDLGIVELLPENSTKYMAEEDR